jgi:hypothetical protein
MADATQSPLTKAMEKLFSDELKCWAVHIEGPDDIIPAPSKELAQFAANVTNSWLCEKAAPDFPEARAVVVEWTHGYEEWKAGSEQFAAEWADWIKRENADAGAR